MKQFETCKVSSYMISVSNSLDPVKFLKFYRQLKCCFACWVILHVFRFKVYFFFKVNFFLKNLTGSNSLDTDQARQNVMPDRDPNCFQRLSADKKSCQLHQNILRTYLVYVALQIP